MQFQKGYRLIRITGLMHRETKVTHKIDSIHSNQKFVLHD